MAFAAAIGFFDGVHTGHRYVLEHLQKVASEDGLCSAVVVFEDHPQTVLRGVHVPLLTTFEERVELLKQSGINEILAFRFEEIRHLTAEAFMHLLHEEYDVSELVMGYDHHFGSDRLSAFTDYEICAERVGVRLVCLSQNPNSNASSTAIRHALKEGDINNSNILLGYPYTIKGVVVPGRQIGRKMGFPTANLRVAEEKMIPKAGVYVCEVEERMALLNIGTNPTVHGTEQTIELHLPNFEGDLYGKQMKVKLLKYLRPERKFETIEALRQQIAQDIEALK